MKVYHTLKPIYNKESKILILGSMPSIKSREANFYYANQSNRFWPIMEQLFNIQFKTNQEKVQFLLKSNIALWDVIESCEINGSSDASIKEVKVNKIKELINNSKIEYVFCTGKLAYNLFNKYFNLPIIVNYLPSPSSANASFSLAKLCLEYQKTKDCLNK